MPALLILRVSPAVGDTRERDRESLAQTHGIGTGAKPQTVVCSPLSARRRENRADSGLVESPTRLVMAIVTITD